MEPIFTHLLKSAGILTLFLGCYHVFLKRETFFTANRLFLLLGIVFSIALPFLKIVRTVWIVPTPSIDNSQTIPYLPNATTESPFDLTLLILVAYATGTFIMLIRLLVQSLSLTKVLRKGATFTHEGIKIVETAADIPPCSFFNRIIYNPSKVGKTELPKIIDHEKCHVRQYHSVDIMTINLLIAFQWFNPFIWGYRRAMQQNLEYLADAEALKAEHCKKEYQYLLLKSHIGSQFFSLTNPFFNTSSVLSIRLNVFSKIIGFGGRYGQIKKRIVMLNKSKSPKTNFAKLGIIIPLLTVFVFLFNIKTEAKVKKEAQSVMVEQNVPQTHVITKETTDSQIEGIKDKALAQKAVLEITHLERNENDDISKISLEYKVENRGHVTGNYSGEDGIHPVLFGIDEDGGIYISSKRTAEVTLPAKSEGNEVIITSNSEHQDGNPQEQLPSKIIVHDSVDGKVMATGEASGISLDLQDKKPLILLDGKEIPHSSLDLLSPDQIKSMNVLKGQYAISRYGEKATDGVIEIQTKDSRFKPIIYDKSKAGDFSPLGISVRSKYIDSPTPLYFIDGKEATKEVFEKVNPETIESVNVLKGEKAIEKYGQKGKDGVIEVKTKKSSWKVGHGKMPENAANMSYFDFLIQIRRDNPDLPQPDPNLALILLNGKETTKNALKNITVNDVASSRSIQGGETAIRTYGKKGENGVLLITTKNEGN